MDSTNQEREARKVERSQMMVSTFSEETRDQEMASMLRWRPSSREKNGEELREMPRMSRRKALTAQAPTVLTMSSPFSSKMERTNQEREARKVERSQRMVSRFSEETIDLERNHKIANMSKRRIAPTAPTMSSFFLSKMERTNLEREARKVERSQRMVSRFSEVFSSKKKSTTERAEIELQRSPLTFSSILTIIF